MQKFIKKHKETCLKHKLCYAIYGNDILFYLFERFFCRDQSVRKVLWNWTGENKHEDAVAVLIRLFCMYIKRRILPQLIKKEKLSIHLRDFIEPLFLWVGFETMQQWLIDISLIGIGISILPLITTIVDCSSQCFFPLGEGTSGGSMFFGGYTFASIVILFFGFYIGHNDTS